MRTVGQIRFFVFNTSTSSFVEYTDGFIRADVKRGAQAYKGPFTQPDVGQLVLTSRNPDLDPYTNSLIKYGARVYISGGGTALFSGNIEGIDIEYKPMGEPAEITITAVDTIGLLVKSTLSDNFIEQQDSWTLSELFTSLPGSLDAPYFNVSRNIATRPQVAMGPIASNTTIWDALSIRAKTNLGYFSCRRGGAFSYVSCLPSDPSNPFNAFPIRFYFRSDGTGTSYQSLQISDGFERVVNDVTIFGIGTQAKIVNGASAGLWNKVQADVTLSSDDSQVLQEAGNEVLQEMAQPLRDIYSITFDAIRAGAAQTGGTDIMDNIQITHEVSPSLTIDRKYQIIGTNHTIDYENWTATYILRNVDYENVSINNPVIYVTPESGDQYDDFTFSYTFDNPAAVSSLSWDLDDGFTSTDPSPTVNYVLGGTKAITLTVNTIYGYSLYSTIYLDVSASAPTGTISYSVDANKIYTFTWVGEAATSYVWDLGNGVTKTGSSVYTTYSDPGYVTVSVQATNQYGTTTATKGVTVEESQNIEIRYIQFRLKGSTESTEDFSGTSSTAPFILPTMSKIILNSVTRGNLTASLLSWKEISNFATFDVTTTDAMLRSIRVEEDDFITNVFATSGNQNIYFPSYRGRTPVKAKMPQYNGLLITLELDEPCVDLQTIAIETAGNSLSMTAEWDVVVSEDATNWFVGGTISYFGNNVTRYAINNNIIEKTASPAPALLTYKKIRYIKLVTPGSATDYPVEWRLNQFFACPSTGSGGPTVGLLSKPNNARTFIGIQDSNKNIGSTVILEQNTSPGYSTGPITRYSSTRTPPFPPVATAVNNVFPVSTISYINSGDLTYDFRWSELTSTAIPNPLGTGPDVASGAKTFIIDMGEVKENIASFYFDFRDKYGYWQDFSTYWPYFIPEIFFSEDGINWENYGGIPIGSTPNTYNGTGYITSLFDTTEYVSGQGSANYYPPIGSVNTYPPTATFPFVASSSILPLP